MKQRAHDASHELLAFADADALRALDVIVTRRPRVVALERLFAATPRGAALINRIKADPALVEAEIRVMAHDSDYVRVSPRAAAAAAAATAPTPAAEPVADAMAGEVPAPPLDQRGTRRAPRHRMAGQVDAHLDGHSASIVDLSTIGAQVVAAGVLKPNQRVRVALTDSSGVLRFNAAVAWASFEIPPKIGPRYRAGLEFVDADAAAVDAFCTRHKA